MKRFTVDEVARKLRRLPEMVRIWLREGRLRGEKYGPTWIVTEPELRRFIRSDLPDKRRRGGK